jgi:hypothetical protein
MNYCGDLEMLMELQNCKLLNYKETINIPMLPGLYFFSHETTRKYLKKNFNSTFHIFYQISPRNNQFRGFPKR